MKRTIILLLCGMSLSACTFEQMFQIPTQTPVPSLTGTLAATAPPTPTPTIPTPTFTLTVTLVGQKTKTLPPRFTATLATTTPLTLFTPNTPTSRVDMKGFVNVFTSVSEFYKPGSCRPSSVKFTAQVAKPSATAFVQLFVRFKSKKTGVTSQWTSIKMANLGAGTFIYELTATEMKGVDSFINSWVEYQLVATDANIFEIGRTDIFGEHLSVLECTPAMVPSELPLPSSSPSPITVPAESPIPSPTPTEPS